MPDFRIDVVVEPSGSGLAVVEQELEELEQQAEETGRAVSRSLSNFEGLEAFQRDLHRQQQLVGQSAASQEVLQAEFRATDAAAAAGLKSIGGLNVLFADTARQVRAIQEARGRAGIAGTIADLERQNEVLKAEVLVRRQGTAAMAAERAVMVATQQARTQGVALTTREAAAIRALTIENEKLAASRTTAARSAASSPLVGIVSTIAITASIAAVGQLVDAYTEAQNKIRIVTDGEAELAEVTQRLFDVANETRQSFAATTTLYTRLAQNADRLGRSQQQLLDITESINKAVIVSGASATEASNGLIQLSQAIASNRLQGDELRSVLEQLPIVAEIITQRLGITRGQLKELARDGQITGEVILSAFEQAREELDERFKRTIPTVGQAFTVLRNDIQSYVGATSSAIGANEGLARIILTVADNVDILAISVTGLAGALGPTLLLGSVRAARSALVSLVGLIAANPWLALASAVAGAAAATAVYFANVDRARIDTDALLSSVGSLEEKTREIEQARFGTAFAEQSGNAAASAKSLTDQITGLEKVIEDLQAGGTATPSIIERLLPNDAEVKRLVGNLGQAVADGSEVFVKEASAAYASLPLRTETAVELIRKKIAELTRELSDAKTRADLVDPESIRRAQEALNDFQKGLEREATAAGTAGVAHAVLAAQLRAADLATRAGIVGTDQYRVTMERVTQAVLSRNQAEGQRDVEAFIQNLRDEQAAAVGQAEARLQGRDAEVAFLAVLEAEQIALKAGITLTEEQRQAIIQLASAKASAAGQATTEETIASLRERVELLRGQAEALRISADEEAVYTAVQTASNEARRNGTVLTQEQILAIRELTLEQRALTTQVDALRTGSETASRTFGQGFEDAFNRSAIAGRDFGKTGEDIFAVLQDTGIAALTAIADGGTDAYKRLAAAAIAEINRIIARQIILMIIGAFNPSAGAAAGAASGAAGGGGLGGVGGAGGTGGIASAGGGSAGMASAAALPQRSFFNPDTQAASMSSAGAQKSPVNVNVINVRDPDEMRAALSSGDLDEVVLNVLARNRTRSRSLIG